MRGAGIVAVCTALSGILCCAGASARPVPVALDVKLADTASRLCVDVLSSKVALLAPGNDVWHAAYGLTEGLPKEAVDTIGAGANVISRATLMSGVASDGAYIVALGGAAGETCRLIVYRAAGSADLGTRTVAALAAPARGWKALPTPPQYTSAGKQSLFLRRDGKPYLANVLTPASTGPVALAVVVAAIPPQVTLPPGY